MTKRAVFIGLVVAGIIGFIGFFNDMVMHQTFMVGHYMPIFLYGSLLVVAVAINPLLRKVWKRSAFSGAEMAVIIALALPACYVSSRTLIHHFTECLIRPKLHAKVQPGWRKGEFIRRTPSRMLVTVPPTYRPADILKASQVASSLNSSEHVMAKALNSKLPDAVRQKLDAGTPEDVAGGLNQLVTGNQLFTPEDVGETNLPQEPAIILASGVRSDEETAILNRACIDSILGKDLVRSRQHLQDYAFNSFETGLSTGDEHIAVNDIPWYAWSKTLLSFWVPLIMSISIAFVGLALIVKRQWSENEHLPFPIARFAQALFPEEDKTMASIFKIKGFWIAVGLVVAFHMINYAYAWWPDLLVRVPNFVDFTGMKDLLPVIVNGGGGGLFVPTFYFTLVGFAYFVSKDVSFSVGIAPFVFALVCGTLLIYGIEINGKGDYNSLRLSNFVKSGAYLGLFLIIIFTGRHFYSSVLKRALGLKSEQGIQPQEYWGVRIFFVGALAYSVQLIAVGCHWPWALAHTVIICIAFFVVSRMLAETGLLLIHPCILTGVFLWGFFGTRVVGGDQFLIIMLVGVTLEFGSHIGVMPMMLHGLKITDRNPLKVAGWGSLGLALALCIGIVTALYFQYDRGTSTVGDNWGKRLGTRSFQPVLEIETELSAKGVLDTAGTHSGLDWVKNISPSKSAVTTFLITMCLVILCEVLRLRVTKWPIHPIIFLISGFWHAQMAAASFLLGWLVKVIVQKYGGSRAYNQIKPVMIGLIAGDMLAGIIIMVISFIYYLYTGEQAPRYILIPG